MNSKFTMNVHTFSPCVKVKQSLFRPRQTLRFPGGDIFWTTVDSIPNRSKKSLFIEFSLIGCGAHLLSYPWILTAFYPGEKWPGHEADLSPVFDAGINKAYSNTFTPSPHMPSWHDAWLRVGKILHLPLLLIKLEGFRSVLSSRICSILKENIYCGDHFT